MHPPYVTQDGVRHGGNPWPLIHLPLGIGVAVLAMYLTYRWRPVRGAAAQALRLASWAALYCLIRFLAPDGARANMQSQVLAMATGVVPVLPALSAVVVFDFGLVLRGQLVEHAHLAPPRGSIFLACVAAWTAYAWPGVLTLVDDFPPHGPVPFLYLAEPAFLLCLITSPFVALATLWAIVMTFLVGITGRPI